jgi:hypothetical protein
VRGPAKWGIPALGLRVILTVNLDSNTVSTGRLFSTAFDLSLAAATR